MSYPSTNDDRLWAMLAYILAIFFPFVAPLIIFLVKRQQRFVAFHAAQAALIAAALAVLGVVITLVSAILAFFGPLALLALLALPLWWGLGLLAWVCKIIGAIKAGSGEWYRVPVIADLADRFV